MPIEHDAIPNAGLHEPKGVSSAASGTVYVADGLGSGSWRTSRSGLTGHGFIDYNDTSTTTTPLAITADTWITIPNDGAGAFTNKTYAPDGVTELMNVTTGAIDPTQLSLGDMIFIRNDYTITPTTNNASLEFRYQLGGGANIYYLETRLGRLDSGSGIPYRFSLRVDEIYMGDLNTRDNPIYLQVKCSSAGSLVNAGSVISALRYNI